MSVIEKSAAPGGRQECLSDVVYEKMRSLIAEGVWPPRSRLPSEAELSARFSVSRPVVRQALARLREVGLIASRQGSGSFVQSPGLTANREVRFPPISSVADLERCMLFREGVEGEAAATAAISASDAHLKLLRRMVENAAHTNDIVIGAESDFEFHLTVAKASENNFYVNTLISLREQILFGMNLARRFSGQDPNVARLIVDQHAAVANAIVQRDAEQARLLMRKHIEWSRNRLLKGGAEVRE